MYLLLSLASAFVLLHPSLFTAPTLAQKDNSPTCSCYRTSGDASSDFVYYRFYDFRHIPLTYSNNYLEPPPNVTVGQSNGTEPPTSSFFTTAPFTKDWSMQSWVREASDVAAVATANSPQNLFIRKSSPCSTNYIPAPSVQHFYHLTPI